MISKMAGPIWMKLSGIVEGGCENDLVKSFFPKLRINSCFGSPVQLGIPRYRGYLLNYKLNCSFMILSKL